MKIFKALKFVFVLLIGYSAGYFSRPFLEQGPPVKIIKETKTEYKIIKQPITFEDYRRAFNTPIKIYTKINKDWLNIRASDTWKESEKSIKIKISQNKHWKYYIGAGIITGGIITYFILK